MEYEIKPILKWVGGKRQLADKILPLISDNLLNYVEPFIGGGAIFFKVQPKNAIINDSNVGLINVYKIIKNNPKELISKLLQHDKLFTPDYYYAIRSLDRLDNFHELSEIDKAARFIFLNRTCYNGLYRVNSLGQFNTPIGSYKNPTIVNEKLINNLSEFFNKNNIKMTNGDYSEVLKNLDDNSFVYLDPPYVPISPSSSFTSYTKDGFDLKKQEQLKIECDLLNNKGIRFLQSNSDCDFIRNLYKNYSFVSVSAHRSINSNANLRGLIPEVLIKNF